MDLRGHIYFRSHTKVADGWVRRISGKNQCGERGPVEWIRMGPGIEDFQSEEAICVKESIGE
jgi:hypothetical protein